MEVEGCGLLVEGRGLRGRYGKRKACEQPGEQAWYVERMRRKQFLRSVLPE